MRDAATKVLVSKPSILIESDAIGGNDGGALLDPPISVGVPSFAFF
jgi:hypothetical protein